MKTQRTPIRTATGAALLAIITVALAAGCYWTPQEQTGGISIAVDTGALSASAAGESSISASATGDADTFLLAFVIAESLLRGDPTAAESALENVNVAWQDELSSFVQAQINGTAVETGISTIDVGTDLVKAQVGFFSAGTGGGGTSSFSGLRAGERYLVVIAGSSSASQQEELFGFESVTIAGGETQTVPIALNRTQAEYNAYLAEEFGVDGGSTGSTAPATVDLTVTAQPGGFYLTNPQGYPLPSAYYYDIVDASDTTIDFSTYVSDGNFVTTPPLGTDLDDALGNLTIIDAAGNTLPSATGTRPSISTYSLFTISDLPADGKVQIIVTSAQNRSDIVNLSGSFPSELTAIGISDVIDLSQTTSASITFYVWGGF